MAPAKSSAPRKPAALRAAPIQPMPFPGESPTVSLAIAAGRLYGLNEEDARPARSRKAAKARPKRPANASRRKAAGKRAAPAKRAASRKK